MYLCVCVNVSTDLFGVKSCLKPIEICLRPVIGYEIVNACSQSLASNVK